MSTHLNGHKNKRARLEHADKILDRAGGRGKYLSTLFFTNGTRMILVGKYERITEIEGYNDMNCTRQISWDDDIFLIFKSTNLNLIEIFQKLLEHGYYFLKSHNE
jgi:hypothetical protein